jgi:NADPH:quinone reductase-like Zn-dependent oxidoreductase
MGSTGGRRADFRTVVKLLEAGRIRAVIHAVYPLADAAKALAGLSSPERVGKILLEA